MNTKTMLLADIKTSLSLLSKYAEKENVDYNAIISSVIKSTDDKNMIDLFVIREMIKDTASAVLASALDQSAEENKDDSLEDFEDPDMENLNLDSEFEETEEPVELTFAERQSAAIDKAQGYIQAIDLGINSIQNGDIDLNIIGQFIDLKTLIKTSMDELAAISDESEELTEEEIKNNEKKLNLLESIMNTMDSNNEGSVSLENIITDISEGSVDTSTNVTDLIDKLTLLIENPEEISSVYTSEEEKENPETESLESEEESEPEVTAADELVEDVQKNDNTEKSSSIESGNNPEEDEENPVTGSCHKKSKRSITAETVEDQDDIFSFNENELLSTRGRLDCSEPLLGEDTTPYVDEIEDVEFDSGLNTSSEEMESESEEESIEDNDFLDELSRLEEDFDEEDTNLESSDSNIKDEDVENSAESETEKTPSEEKIEAETENNTQPNDSVVSSVVEELDPSLKNEDRIPKIIRKNKNKKKFFKFRKKH